MLLPAWTNTAIEIKYSDSNSNKVSRRKKQGRDREAVYDACPHFHQSVSGVSCGHVHWEQLLREWAGHSGNIDSDSD